LRAILTRPDRGQLGFEGVAAAVVFGLGFAQFAVGGFAQVFEFFGLQFAHLAGLDIEHQGTVAYAANLFYVVADLLKHLAELAITAFDEDDFVPGIVALADLADLRGGGMDATRAGLAAFDSDASAEAIEGFLSGLAADFYEVGFLHTCGGPGEFVGQVAVVGHEQQAFAQVVETANGIETFARLREELHHRRAAFGIAHRGHEALGLVEHVVAETLGALEQFAIDADVVVGSIGLTAELGDDFAVDLNAALGDQLFGMAAAGDSSLGENLLEAIEFRSGCRFCNGVDLLVDFRGVHSGSVGIFRGHPGGAVARLLERVANRGFGGFFGC
jgi:hypothetical protein